MGMSQEQAAAAIHAAKMAQLSTLGQNFDKLPQSLLPPHLDLSKLNRQSPDMNRMQPGGGVTIEQTKIPTSYANSGRNSADIRRDDSQPMDLGGDGMQAKDRNCRRDSDNNGASNNANSSGEDEYGSDDDGDREKN